MQRLIISLLFAANICCAGYLDNILEIRNSNKTWELASGTRIEGRLSVVGNVLYVVTSERYYHIQTDDKIHNITNLVWYGEQLDIIIDAHRLNVQKLEGKIYLTEMEKFEIVASEIVVEEAKRMKALLKR